jgi:hypothetical protein
MPSDAGPSHDAHELDRLLQGHARVASTAEGDEMHPGAEQLVQQEVACQARRPAREIEQMWLKSQLAGGCRGETGMV